MNLSLFIVVLGGRSLKSNIELHDVRWVLGESIEDTFPELREQWFGRRKGLHIDSYKRIQYVDGYKISVSKSNKDMSINNKKENELLWFINLGGYCPKKMYEEHKFILVVAKKAIDAKKKAKKYWESDLKLKHNDDCSGINNFEKVDDIHSIKRINNWEIELINDPEKRSEELIPDWYGYMRIDKY
ncbi:DUF1543 domain-containing protein [Prochlorococcus marinus]|uniref:DUF1543 domain-containing protein n=1 Tax=Prochlorococcus marinus XMU1408 TaxID=2213228 RepID=A0A318R5G3_PROMR|nr:DUF1543 domain-containing protein [Prochlorococcus marinus]MBW3041703.1 DUF1543 domain-containing protein [Prochlorococcus marinus str. XMU1408]PYE02852.1 DUF1543 domain-containing protein [Prochlorococcus marinus XMU1408]